MTNIYDNQVTKSRRLRWAGHAARMVESRVAYRVLVLKTEGDLLEDRGVDVVIILKWMLEKWDAGHGLDRSCSGYGQGGGLL